MWKDSAGNEFHVRDLKNGNQTYDLADYLELTARGERWAKRICASENENPKT